MVTDIRVYDGYTCLLFEVLENTILLFYLKCNNSFL